MTNCITHHHACDCREEAHRVETEKLENRVQSLEHAIIVHAKRVWEDRAEDMARMGSQISPFKKWLCHNWPILNDQNQTN